MGRSSSESKTRIIGQMLDWVHKSTNVIGNVYATEYIVRDEKIGSNHMSKGKITGGGEWIHVTTQIKRGGDRRSIYRPFYGVAYIGDTTVGVPINQRITESEIAQVYLDAKNLGAEAWSKMRPAQPSFSAATSLYELKDLAGVLKLRHQSVRAQVAQAIKNFRPGVSLFGRRPTLKWLRSAAGRYWLSLNFGIIPLISDTSNFARTWLDRDKIYRQLERDNGRPVRRRCTLTTPPTKTTTTVYQKAYPWNNDVVQKFVTQCYASSNNKCKSTVVRTDEYDAWGSGKFEYILPKLSNFLGDKSARRRLIMRRILGLDVNLKNIYNVMPWSWLLDYFSGISKVIDATSQGVEENLWAHYCYVMMTYTRTITIECTEAVYYNSSGTYYKKSTLNLIETVKVRVKASPFGFNLEDKDLSLHQAGILGALGFSRLP